MIESNEIDHLNIKSEIKAALFVLGYSIIDQGPADYILEVAIHTGYHKWGLYLAAVHIRMQNNIRQSWWSEVPTIITDTETKELENTIIKDLRNRLDRITTEFSE